MHKTIDIVKSVVTPYNCRENTHLTQLSLLNTRAAGSSVSVRSLYPPSTTTFVQNIMVTLADHPRRGNHEGDGRIHLSSGRYHRVPKHIQDPIRWLSGVDLSDVRVHHDSAEPRRFGAAGFAAGDSIYLSPGCQSLLPHEAWHIVQARQGRVKPTGRCGGYNVNEDVRLELEADVMGTRVVEKRHTRHLDAVGLSTTRDRPPRGNQSQGSFATCVSKAPIQMVKVPPTGNFARYVGGNLTNSGITLNVHPNDAEVATEARYVADSEPADSYGHNALNEQTYTLTGGAGGANTVVTFDAKVDVKGNHLFRMHLIHHRLADNANDNIDNIVLGPNAYNRKHSSHVEQYLVDSMESNFYKSTGDVSLHVALVNTDGINVTGTGVPYGTGGTMPNSLRDPGAVGVPLGAYGLATDEDVLDRHSVLWYFVRPTFGLNAVTLENNITNEIVDVYNNDRLGAVTGGEAPPGGILGAGGVIQNAAAALAGIYATRLEINGSLFTPDPSSINGAATADQLPWHDNRLKRRTLTNNRGAYVKISMDFDGGMGIGNLASTGDIVRAL